jgi:hypothetical protein
MLQKGLLTAGLENQQYPAAKEVALDALVCAGVVIGRESL